LLTEGRDLIEHKPQGGRNMRKKLWGTVAAAGALAVVLGLSTLVAWAAPPSFVVELLSRGTTAKAFDAESAGIELEADHKIDVATARVTLPTGSTSGWHSHPGPTVVTVTKGILTFISHDCVRHRLMPGDTFVENGGPHHVGRLNNWYGAPGEITVTFFAPPGADPLTIPAPAPACASNS
jgi:quercetin dioxygenase-like cupin family protein